LADKIKQPSFADYTDGAECLAEDFEQASRIRSSRNCVGRGTDFGGVTTLAGDEFGVVGSEEAQLQESSLAGEKEIFLVQSFWAGSAAALCPRYGAGANAEAGFDLTFVGMEDSY
jgi:hypothetical protein